MVAISFSVFKDKLLSGEKCQTIRKLRAVAPAHNRNDLAIKVGTPLQIYWKQRQKKVFDKQSKVQIDGSEHLFNAVCTETFFVRMWKGEKGYTIRPEPTIQQNKLNLYTSGFAFGLFDFYLANRDGFEGAEKMFEWFDEHYDLSKPQIFQVIRWEKEAKK